jgi:colanic acid/amylovoran biosynthesis glycosyltransferase
MRTPNRAPTAAGGVRKEAPDRASATGRAPRPAAVSKGRRGPPRGGRRYDAMRVAYVTMRFPEPTETFASNEVRILSGLGIDITVHSLRGRRPDTDRMLHDRDLAGLATTFNGAMATLRGAWSALLRPRLLLQVLAWIVRANRARPRDLALSLILLPRAFDVLAAIERDPPDVVHIYWGHLPSLVGFLVQRRLPQVVTSMAIVAYDLLREYGGTIEVARRADVVRTHAIANVDHITRFTGVPPERIDVIYNGVDVDKLADLARHHPKVPRRIATVARLIEVKGTDRVLEAFAAIRARWPDATLVVVGSGPDRERLEALRDELMLGESVEFRGLLPHDEALAEVARAEVLMLLSRLRSDRLPNVVKEGMACGCICVTTFGRRSLRSRESSMKTSARATSARASSCGSSPLNSTDAPRSSSSRMASRRSRSGPSPTTTSVAWGQRVRMAANASSTRSVPLTSMRRATVAMRCGTLG